MRSVRTEEVAAGKKRKRSRSDWYFAGALLVRLYCTVLTSIGHCGVGAVAIRHLVSLSPSK